MDASIPAPSSPDRKTVARAALALGALGVVFGDIGTSPLYAIQTVFSSDAARPVEVDTAAAYGVASLVFWALVIVVTLKYVVFVMRADNDGEGGIMALIALLDRRVGAARLKRLPILVALGIFGAALFAGDAMITPAISVLSAVEGLGVVEPTLEHLVIPIAAAILIGLFAIQARGTAVIGRWFGPIVLVWFVSLAALGINGIADHPGVLQGLSPTYAFEFILDHGLTAFLALGGVVLVVTGAEALYADMGHFGRPAVAQAWLLIAFPALILNYLGQAALLVEHPEAASNPFYLLAPEWARIPMIFLACAATIIASQAVISGAFSIARQAVQLGYLPRLRVLHTSHAYGQIYVPFINWALLAAVLVLVLTFKESSNLASAYGIAVTGTFIITLALFLFFARHQWGWSRWKVGLAAGVFGIVDVAFFTANADKIVTGGWLPLIVGLGIYVVLSTWQQGRRIVTRNREEAEGPLPEFTEMVRKRGKPATVRRVPGTAVFLNRGTETTPLAMRENVIHNHTLHETALILSIETLPVPYVAPAERLTIDPILYRDDGIAALTAKYGFQEQPDVMAVLAQAAKDGLESDVDLHDVTYFLSRIEIVPTARNGMPVWRKRLFLATAHLSSDAVDYFQLPRERTVLLGSTIEL